MNHTLSRPFLWRTHAGESIPVPKMETSHLFHSLRMVFNHTVPKGYEIPGCKRWNLGPPLQRRLSTASRSRNAR